METDNGLLEFMVRRQADSRVALDIVAVKWIGGGQRNACFHNAHGIAASGDFKVVSGWLVLPYDRQSGTRHFVQHWWNHVPRLGQYVDTTPEIEDGSIYVTDIAIAQLCVAHNDVFQTQCIATTVLYGKKSFYAIDHRASENDYRKLALLRNEDIFPQCFAELAL